MFDAEVADALQFFRIPRYVPYGDRLAVLYFGLGVQNGQKIVHLTTVSTRRRAMCVVRRRQGFPNGSNPISTDLIRSLLGDEKKRGGPYRPPTRYWEEISGTSRGPLRGRASFRFVTAGLSPTRLPNSLAPAGRPLRGSAFKALLKLNYRPRIPRFFASL